MLLPFGILLALGSIVVVDNRTGNRFMAFFVQGGSVDDTVVFSDRESSQGGYGGGAFFAFQFVPGGVRDPFANSRGEAGVSGSEDSPGDAGCRTGWAFIAYAADASCDDDPRVEAGVLVAASIFAALRTTGPGVSGNRSLAFFVGRGSVDDTLVFSDGRSSTREPKA